MNWRDAVKQAAGDPYAQCYVMAEAYWHLEGRRLGWSPVRGRGFTRSTGMVSHWWLEKDGRILDLSRAQFHGERFPYECGRGGGFLSMKPSIRAAEIIKAARLIHRRSNGSKNREKSVELDGSSLPRGVAGLGSGGGSSRVRVSPVLLGAEGHGLDGQPRHAVAAGRLPGRSA